MHVGLLSFALALATSGCATRTAAAEAETCVPGQRCRVAGILQVESKWQISLDQERSCYALALPEDFARRHKGLGGKRVTVIGGSFGQPGDAAGRASLGYEVDGMRVNDNLCDLAISVESIEQGNKVLWRSPQTK